MNVNYPDAAVYANFARKLQVYNWRFNEQTTVKKDDIVKFKWFSVRDGDKDRILGITVFPYRNGSKVSYRWDSNIACQINSGCNFDPSAAKRMQDMVKSIAND